MMDGINPKDLLGIQKDPIGLVPPEGIRGIARAMKYGASKYGPYNWRNKKVQYQIYVDAMFRHLLSIAECDDFDEESGLLHLTHIGANVVLLLDAIKYKCLVDNRHGNIKKLNLERPGSLRELTEQAQELNMGYETKELDDSNCIDIEAHLEQMKKKKSKYFHADPHEEYKEIAEEQRKGPSKTVLGGCYLPPRSTDHSGHDLHDYLHELDLEVEKAANKTTTTTKEQEAAPNSVRHKYPKSLACSLNKCLCHEDQAGQLDNEESKND